MWWLLRERIVLPVLRPAFPFFSTMTVGWEKTELYSWRAASQLLVSLKLIVRNANYKLCNGELTCPSSSADVLLKYANMRSTVGCPQIKRVSLRLLSCHAGYYVTAADRQPCLQSTPVLQVILTEIRQYSKPLYTIILYSGAINRNQLVFPQIAPYSGHIFADEQKRCIWLHHRTTCLDTNRLRSWLSSVFPRTSTIKYNFPCRLWMWSG